MTVETIPAQNHDVHCSFISVIICNLCDGAEFVFSESAAMSIGYAAGGAPQIIHHAAILFSIGSASFVLLYGFLFFDVKPAVVSEI